MERELALAGTILPPNFSNMESTSQPTSLPPKGAGQKRKRPQRKQMSSRESVLPALGAFLMSDNNGAMVGTDVVDGFVHQLLCASDDKAERMASDILSCITCGNIKVVKAVMASFGSVRDTKAADPAGGPDEDTEEDEFQHAAGPGIEVDESEQAAEKGSAATECAAEAAAEAAAEEGPAVSEDMP